MCRNIKTLFNFDPPVTEEEIRAASLQFVRKISGFNKPSKANEGLFMAAVDEIAGISTRLLLSLETNAPPKNREEEAAKAKVAQRRDLELEYLERELGFGRDETFRREVASSFARAISLSKAIASDSIPRYRKHALTPEVVDPRIADVEALARWFDYAFALPGGFRFGFDGIIGLIPVAGDVFSALASLYIVARAIQLRISRVAIARMLVNVGIDALVGSVPFIGDLFDITFKANRRNYQLLKNHMSQPARQSAYDWLFLIVTVVLVMATIALPVIGLIKLANYL